MKVVVTKDHINRGVRLSLQEDPVALAMLDAGLFNPWVQPDSIVWTDDAGRLCSAEPPDEVYDFMRKFDAKGKRGVLPFKFELVDTQF